MRSLIAIAVAEIKMYIREPFAFFFSIIFPIFLLLLFGASFGSEDLGGYRGIDLTVAMNLSFLIANLGIMGIPISTVEQKHTGVFKRFQVLPVPKLSLFMGTISTSIVVFILSTALILTTAVILFNVTFFGNLLEVIIMIVLGLTTFLSLGYLIALLPVPPRTIQIIASAVFFIMLFFSGVILPLQEMPVFLQSIVQYSPLTIVTTLLGHAWVNEQSIFLNLGYLILLAVYAVGFLLIVKLFPKNEADKS
ncbi:MAG: ABC transporter permease [Halanaerobiales bacterium]